MTTPPMLREPNNLSATPCTVRVEWGTAGIRVLGPTADILVIVDVLSFSTCVEVAVSRGATVFPYPSHDDSAEAFAVSQDAHLARKRGEGTYSLSPATLSKVGPDFRIVLPSPNGSTLCLAARKHGTVFVGCLRNASAVAHACEALGGVVAIIPAGERWPSDGLRPALEDYLGAGAIVGSFRAARLSPEATAARAAFKDAEPRLQDALFNCASGRELCESGFAADIEIAAALDVSSTVPRLDGDSFH